MIPMIVIFGHWSISGWVYESVCLDDNTMITMLVWFWNGCWSWAVLRLRATVCGGFLGVHSLLSWFGHGNEFYFGIQGDKSGFESDYLHVRFSSGRLDSLFGAARKADCSLGFSYSVTQIRHFYKL